MNQLYYQITHTKLSWWDKVVKIGVGALATAALLGAFVPDEFKWAEIVTAALAVVAAVALNVIPVGEWASDSRAAICIME